MNADPALAPAMESPLRHPGPYAVMTARSRWAGSLLILLSAACFAVMPVFAQRLCADGLRPVDFLLLRFGLASCVLWALVVLRRLALPRGRTLATLLAMGAIGYAGQSMSYFTALTLAPAAIVALLLYLYPVFVTLLAWLFLRERPGVRKWAALVLAMTGCGFTIGYASGARPLGILIATVAALIYAVYIIAGRTLDAATPALAQAAVVCSAATGSMILLNLPGGPRMPGSAGGWLAAVALALVGTVVAVAAFLAGLKRLGPTRAATLSTVEPVLTAIAGTVFLAQPLGTGAIAGGLLILVAAVLIVRE